MALQIATLGGGCFWCLEAVYQEMSGVVSVVSGYAGGHVPNPTYEQVCSKKTGHVEVVEVTFDRDLVSFKDVLEVFFTIHDPTTPDRQGNDVGPQYRSVIFYHSNEQRQVAEQFIREMDAEQIWTEPVVTQVLPAPEFFPAENYHQNYLQNNPRQPYCMFVVAPKVAKFRQRFSNGARSASDQFS